MDTPDSSPTSQSDRSESQPLTRVPRGRKFLALILTLIVFPILAVVALEVFFVLFVPVTDVPFHFWDPILGPRRAPNQTGRYIYGEVINAPYHFNAQGWNHPHDYQLEKPPGVRRVCIVGDSMIEALQVPGDQAMFVRAEKIMSRPERPVQWYAFGCSGWGTTREEAAIRHYLLEYQPDVVLLMFVQNDPVDCSPYVVKLESYVPHYDLDDVGRLIRRLPGPWAPSGFRRLAARSALVRYFLIQNRLLDRWRLRRQAKEMNIPLRGGTHDLSASDASDPAHRRANQKKTWQLVEAILAAAQTECQQRGAIFAVVYRGHYKRLDAAARGESYEPPPVEEDPYCLGKRADEMGDEFVAPITHRLGIPYLDLTDTLMAHLNSKGKTHHFPDDVHYNADAHRVVSQALAEWVETLWDASSRPTASGHQAD